MPERALSAGARAAELLNEADTLAALAAVPRPSAPRMPLRRIRTLGVRLVSRPIRQRSSA
jgi:hypothetical protein